MTYWLGHLGWLVAAWVLGKSALRRQLRHVGTSRRREALSAPRSPELKNRPGGAG